MATLRIRPRRIRRRWPRRRRPSDPLLIFLTLSPQHLHPIPCNNESLFPLLSLSSQPLSFAHAASCRFGDDGQSVADQASQSREVLRAMPPDIRQQIGDKELAYLVRGANSVRRLIRVKIADDNDLNQATVRSRATKQRSSFAHNNNTRVPNTPPCPCFRPLFPASAADDRAVLPSGGRRIQRRRCRAVGIPSPPERGNLYRGDEVSSPLELGAPQETKRNFKGRSWPPLRMLFLIFVKFSSSQ